MLDKVGDRKIMICKATGKPVEMEYVGRTDLTEDGFVNGHAGWICLHNGE